MERNLNIEQLLRSLLIESKQELAESAGAKDWKDYAIREGVCSGVVTVVANAYGEKIIESLCNIGVIKHDPKQQFVYRSLHDGRKKFIKIKRQINKRPISLEWVILISLATIGAYKVINQLVWMLTR